VGSQRTRTIADTGSDAGAFGGVGVGAGIEVRGDGTVAEALGHVLAPRNREQRMVFVGPETQGSVAGPVASEGAGDRSDQFTSQSFKAPTTRGGFRATIELFSLGILASRFGVCRIGKDTQFSRHWLRLRRAKQVALISQGPDIGSAVNPRFGRAPYLLVVDTDSGEFTTHDSRYHFGGAIGRRVLPAP
jgi:hypothetical protein